MGASPFVAEIAIFPFNFAPKGWAFCDGQLLPLSQNTALFSLLGTNYGGNGESNFALPDFQGQAPLHWGQSTTGSQYVLGQQSGEQTVTLLQSEMPLHSHSLMANAVAGDTNSPGTGVSLARSHNATAYQTTTNQNLVQMDGSVIAPAGSSFPHNNLMPYLTLNFCIAMQGIFPPRG